MSFLVVGTNHKHSPVELRERMSFSKSRLKDALFFLKETNTLKAAVILSTCNRVEIYADAEDSKLGIEEIIGFISRYHEIDKNDISTSLYVHEEKEAFRHLLAVASGLDSLILGETQILGQVKFSFLESENAAFLNLFLRGIFNGALSFAKKIHRETKISEGKVSVGSVAVDFIKEKVQTLADKTILIIGMGKVTDILLQYLRKEMPEVVFISNRNFEKAGEFAAQIGAKAIRFDELKEYLAKADIVISATASPHFIIGKEALEAVMLARRRRAGKNINHKILVIDLAMPRDVDPRTREIKGVELFYLEDLESAIKKNLDRKLEEAQKAKKMIGTEVERVWRKVIESEQELAPLP